LDERAGHIGSLLQVFQGRRDPKWRAEVISWQPSPDITRLYIVPSPHLKSIFRLLLKLSQVAAQGLHYTYHFFSCQRDFLALLLNVVIKPMCGKNLPGP